MYHPSCFLGATQHVSQKLVDALQKHRPAPPDSASSITSNGTKKRKLEEEHEARPGPSASKAAEPIRLSRAPRNVLHLAMAAASAPTNRPAGTLPHDDRLLKRMKIETNIPSDATPQLTRSLSAPSGVGGPRRSITSPVDDTPPKSATSLLHRMEGLQVSATPKPPQSQSLLDRLNQAPRTTPRRQDRSPQRSPLMSRPTEGGPGLPLKTRMLQQALPRRPDTSPPPHRGRVTLAAQPAADPPSLLTRLSGTDDDAMQVDSVGGTQRRRMNVRKRR